MRKIGENMAITLPWAVPVSMGMLCFFIKAISVWDEKKHFDTLMLYIVSIVSCSIVAILLFCRPSNEEKAQFNQRLWAQKEEYDRTHEKPWDIKDLLYD